MLRVMRYGGQIIKTYSLRYSRFTGDQQDGHAITFWYGIFARGEPE